MRTVAPDESDDGRTALTDALDASEIAVNHYWLAPGERFSTGLHAHLDQAELFVVVDGEATFEALVDPAGGDGETDATGATDPIAHLESRRVTVGAGELVRFAPGEYQSGWNGADRPLVAYALGVPSGSTEFRVPVACEACGHGVTRPAVRDGREALVCPACGDESNAACPACGAERLGATVSDGAVVSVCRACGAES